MQSAVRFEDTQKFSNYQEQSPVDLVMTQLVLLHDSALPLLKLMTQAKIDSGLQLCRLHCHQRHDSE